MARPPGTPNKNTAAPNAVASQLKKQLEEKNTLLLEMARLLFEARDRYMAIAQSGGDILLAYEAGQLHALLHQNGFEQVTPTAEQQIGALMGKAAGAGAAKPEEEGGSGRVSSILGQPPARSA